MGMFVARGAVIPTLIVRSPGGWFLMSHVVGALTGAAGFFSAGLSRLTFSLIIFMVEISDSIMIVCVLTAKTVADMLSHSRYRAQIS